MTDIVERLRDDRIDSMRYQRAEAADEIERLRKALEEINAEVLPELRASELELIVWWGRQVDRLQRIAREALAVSSTECGPAATPLTHADGKTP